MIGYDDLNAIIVKTARLNNNNVYEIALGIEDNREAWGIDNEAVGRIARELGEAMSPLVLMIGPKMALATAVSSGFDIGVLAAIEAETRRIIEQKDDAA